MLEILRGLGLKPAHLPGTKDGEYHCACPYCRDGEDRFIFWPDSRGERGTFWCRICGKRGDKIQLLRDFKNMSFAAAARVCGLDLQREGFSGRRNRRQLPAAAPVQDPGEAWQPQAARTPFSKLWQQKCGAFLERCRAQLADNREILAWLKGRGIEASAADKARLGWNPGERGGPLYRPRERWGAPPAYHKASGRPLKLKIPVGLVIPCFNAAGDLQRLRIRQWGQQKQRYYVVPGSGMQLMSVNPEARAQVIVESELDAILIGAKTSAGAIALGSVRVKPDPGAHKTLCRALQILLAIDYDEAGKGAVPWWLDHYQRCRRWPVPKGKDPGEAFSAGVDLEMWIKAGLPPALKVSRREVSPDQPVQAPQSKSAEVSSAQIWEVI